MNDIDKLATERVLKARAELIMARRFYGVLVSNVEPVLSRRFETMATDSKRHFYNPDFIATLTQTQLLAVQAHESEHDARHHSTRRRGRDPKKWNEACDYAINIDLRDEGFDLPPWVLIDEQYRGWSAEDIYRARELDEARQAQKSPQPQAGESDDTSDDGDNDASDESADDDNANEDGDDHSEDDADDDGEGGEDADGDGGGEQGPGDAEGTGDAPAGHDGDGEGKSEGENA